MIQETWLNREQLRASLLCHSAVGEIFYGVDVTFVNSASTKQAMERSY